MIRTIRTWTKTHPATVNVICGLATLTVAGVGMATVSELRHGFAGLVMGLSAGVSVITIALTVVSRVREWRKS